MYVVCRECCRSYDDARCWTICPHGPLEFPNEDYCPRCDTVKLIHGPCEHQKGTQAADTTSQLNENWRTFSIEKPFKNGCEAFNVLSPMPLKPLDLGDERELYIKLWAPVADENVMEGNDFLTIRVEGFIRLKREAKVPNTPLSAGDDSG